MGVIVGNHNECVVSLPETAPSSELWTGVRIGNHNETVIGLPEGSLNGYARADERCPAGCCS